MQGEDPLYLFVLGFVAGIFIASFFVFSSLFLIFLFIFLLFLFKKKTKAFFIFFAFVFALFYYSFWEKQLLVDCWQKYLRREIGLIARIEKIEKKEKNTLLLLKTNRCFSPLGLIIQNNNSFQIGDLIKIRGTIKKVNQSWLRKHKTIFLFSPSFLEVVRSETKPSLLKLVLVFKKRIVAGIRSHLPPSYYGLAIALLFGEEEFISKTMLESLNRSGTRHIVAVSGTNITLICQLVFLLFLSFGFYRQQAILLSLFFIFIFLLMIGFPASGLRAGIMASLLLVAQLFGRLLRPERSLFLALFFILLTDPFLLRDDLGLELSFLASLGLVYLYPVLDAYLKKLPSFFRLKEGFITTFSAQVFVFPLIVYYWGRISLAGLLSNLLILPFIAPLTIIVFLIGFADLFSFSLAHLFWIISWPVFFYLKKIIIFFSSFSFLIIEKQVGLTFLFLAYFILGGIVFFLYQKKQWLV